ncbi:MAG: type IVB secretion system protein IcmH/DotU [Phenylobacterium sp.]
MSDNGDDKNPNKTVFRPSPLQGLKGGVQPAAPATGTAFPTGEAAGPQAAPPPVRARPAPGDDDIPQPAAAAARPRNAMMFAAAQVLALIAGVRSGRVQISMPDLHQKASAAVAGFDQALTSAGYDNETRQRARYAVCATIDDIAQNLPGHAADGAEWARRSLVVQAFNENIGGDRFWRLLEEMLARPAQYADLIELYHACLAVGFEGRYRVTPDGKSKLHEIMTGAYAALQHPRTVSPTELSPRWKGQPTPPEKVSFWATLALAAGVALAVLLVIFIALRLVLMQTGRPSIEALRAINPGQPLRMSRVAPAPPVPTSTQLQRIQAFLAPEIAQHLVAVEQDPQSIRVRTTVGQLFQSGSDALEPGRQALFERIAGAIEPERGGVRVEGHADSDRVASLAFPDNFALSKARAEAVARILRSKLTNAARVTSEGFGDSQPIASNATAGGKALNRRVEIVIPRAQ